VELKVPLVTRCSFEAGQEPPGCLYPGVPSLGQKILLSPGNSKGVRSSVLCQKLEVKDQMLGEKILFASLSSRVLGTGSRG
jgi:hypothetical protein